MNVVQAPSPSFYRWETPWESNDVLRLTQQVTGKAKTCSTFFLEMCRAWQWNTLQVIKTHSFKQHLLCIFSFVLQTSQLLLSPFHLHSKAAEETEWLSKTHKNRTPQKAGFLSVFFTTESLMPETDSDLLPSSYVCGINVLFGTSGWMLLQLK